MGKYRKKPIKVALDVDDVLFSCIGFAVERCNERYHIEPPIELAEMTQWGFSGTRTDITLDEYKREDFFEEQPVFEGAHEFVKKLSEMVDVYFLTAVPPMMMGIRAKRLMEEFPFIPENHIIMTSSKNVVNEMDMILDDGAHNIFASNVKYPVLFRRPWNQHVTGLLAVNTYDDFLALVREIWFDVENKIDDGPKIIALVGPSGSGKTAISEELLKTDFFEKPKSYTTRKRESRDNDDYRYVSKEEFLKMVDNKEIFEWTVYAGEYYGSNSSELKEILKRGKNIVIPIDICGAISLKSMFKNVFTVYVDRRKADLLRCIIERDISTDDKVKRIISLDAEMRNEEICDYSIRNYTDLKTPAKEIIELFCK